MRRWALILLYAGTFAVIGALAWYGRDYYAAPLVERPRHPLHWQLKPGGELGRLYGIVGLGMMVAMLSYSLRKRLPALRKAGKLAGWLDLHIYLGVAGPLFIVLHSSMKVGGLIAISFWSMVAVAVSGILGRFLYAQIPRTASGDELSLEEARKMEQLMAARLRSEFGLDDSDLALLEARQAARSRSLLGMLFGLIGLPFAFRRSVGQFLRRHRDVPRPVVVRMLRIARQRALLRRRLDLWRRLHELFHYWHVLHKPFALLMYLFAAIHVAVAYATGYVGGVL